MKEKVPITHRVYLISGFVLSGKLYISPVDDIPHNISPWVSVDIPNEKLVDVYQRLDNKVEEV